MQGFISGTPQSMQTEPGTRPVGELDVVTGELKLNHTLAGFGSSTLALLHI
jgi:hypothetical protein